MTDLDANRYLTATADNAPQLGDPDPAALVAHDGETDSSHKSALPQLKDTADALQRSTPGLLFKAILVYLDFVSSSHVLYAILLRQSPDLVGPSNVVISILVLPPLALSAMDLYEYYRTKKWSDERAALMGWKGVALNLTNTRML